MPAKSTNSGACALCGHVATKAAMTAHLEACLVAHDNVGPSQPLVALRFDATDDRRYWLIVEAKATTQLRHVDALLRQLWLECCGHMSAFRIGGRELAMTATVSAAFARGGSTVEYEYDFGNTTALTGARLGERTGAIGRAPVRVLARNEPLAWSCAECAAPATAVCAFCIDSGDALFCGVHAETHEHAGEEAYLPVVNSPRMGVCGYTG